jgi:hypothetical protein
MAIGDEHALGIIRHGLGVRIQVQWWLFLPFCSYVAMMLLLMDRRFSLIERLFSDCLA